MPSLQRFRSVIRAIIAVSVAAAACALLLAACDHVNGPTTAPTLPATESPVASRIPSTPSRYPSSAPAKQDPQKADLVIELPELTQLIPGQGNVYTVTIRNQGPSRATDIVLTGQLPTGVVPVWSSSARPTCSWQQGSARCDLGDLRSGDAITVSLDLTAGGRGESGTGAGMKVNTTAFSCDLDQDGSSPAVTCSLPSLDPGSEAELLVGLQVEGEATGSLTHVASVTAAQEDPDQSDNRAVAQLTVDTTIPPDTPARPEGVDLVLITEGPSTMIAGRPYTTSFAVYNQGGHRATGVNLEHPLPPATDLERFVPGPPMCQQVEDTLTCQLNSLEGRPTITFTLIIAGQGDQLMAIYPDQLVPGWPLCSVLKERTYLHILTCALGALEPGQAARAQMVVTARGIQERVITSTTTVTSQEPDLDSLDNSQSVEIPVLVQADLLLEAISDGSPAGGETLSYTLAVTNDGPSDAGNVTLTDTLPAGLEVVTAASDRGDMCRPLPAPNGRKALICALGRIAAGQSSLVSVVVRLAAPPQELDPMTAVHTVTVRSDQVDPDPANNTLSESILAGSEPGVQP